jgi:hypothetical protein
VHDVEIVKMDDEELYRVSTLKVEHRQLTLCIQFIDIMPLFRYINKNLLHSLGLVYKSMRGMITNSIDRDQWLNVTSEL